MIKIIPPVRGLDKQGSGAYLAPRGNRKHLGIDYACFPNSKILSVTPGIVTKIGYPYDPSDKEKGHLRYVQVTTDCIDYRYFYVSPSVFVGNDIGVNGELGFSQDLRPIYKGITPHFHLEIKVNGRFVNPHFHMQDLKGEQ